MNQIRLLFINLQEDEPMKKLGLPHYREWIADVTQLSPNQITVVNVAEGEQLPTILNVDGIIGGGSGHFVDEAEPWMKKTGEFFKAAQKQGIPQLLSCFSHNLVADAYDGQTIIGKNGRRFGIEELELTFDGQKDPLFKDIPKKFEIFTTHRDVVGKKPSSSKNFKIVELAKSNYYANEALSYGNIARTFQAHFELTAKIISPFAQARRNPLTQEGHIGPSDEEYQAYVENIYKKDEQIQKTSKKIVNNWLRYFVIPRIES